MSKSYHQAKSTSVSSQAASTALAFDTNPTTGRSILVMFRGSHVSGYYCGGVSDSQGNTYTQVLDTGAYGTDTPKRSRNYGYVAHNITGGAITVTVSHVDSGGTPRTSNVGFALAIIEFSATAALSTDSSGTAIDEYPVSTSSGPVATAAAQNEDAGAIVFGASFWGNNALEITSTLNSSGYTSIFTSLSSVDYRGTGRVAYKICSALETSSFQVTCAVNDTSQGTMVISFKEPTAGNAARASFHRMIRNA